LERTKNGLNVPSKDFTSDYESFKILRKAERQFLEVALKVVPSSFQKDIKKVLEGYNIRLKDEFLNLSLRFNI